MIDGAGPSRDQLIDSLCQQARAVLDPLVPPGAKCALVDFPNHNNSGDNAIWVGEIEYLKSVGINPAYTCDVDTYSPHQLARKVGDGIILIHGGGNLGDIWPRHQRFRERVIQDFPRNRIIQLPQTIHFSDPNEAERAGMVLRSHRDLTVLVRDAESSRVAQEVLGVRVRTCPDMAFFIGPLRRTATPNVDVVWLSRRDREARGWALPQDPGLSLHVTDWLLEEGNDTHARFAPAVKVRTRRLVARMAARCPEDRLLGGVRDLPSRFFGVLARRRTQRGMRYLCRGRVVVADRLHAHILCILLGIPHVLLDNSFGKIRRFYSEFTQNYPFAVLCNNEVDALIQARRLIDHVGGGNLVKG